MSPALPELFPLLFDKIQNPSVMSLLRAVVPHVVPQLVLRKRLDIIVETLTQSVISILTPTWLHTDNVN